MFKPGVPKFLSPLILALTLAGCGQAPEGFTSSAGGATTDTSSAGGCGGAATAGVESTSSALLGDVLDTGTSTVKFSQRYTCGSRVWTFIVALKQHNDGTGWTDTAVYSNPYTYDIPSTSVAFLACTSAGFPMTTVNEPGGWTLLYNAGDYPSCLFQSHLPNQPFSTGALVDVAPYDFQYISEAPPAYPNGHLQIGMTSMGGGTGLGIDGCTGGTGRLALTDVK